MDKDRELKRFENLILKMRQKVIELHKYNRVMKFLNSISDDKSFEGLLKILGEIFMVDGCCLMVLGEKGLEITAFYGAHQTIHYIAGKGALFFASTALTDRKAQIMRTETGMLLCLPIIKRTGSPFGVLNLYRDSLLIDEAFLEQDQKLFVDIANQIGVSLERVFLDQAGL